METPLTYHQILAQQYEENAKAILVSQTNDYGRVDGEEYEVDAHTTDHGVQLENQDAFRKFAGNRHLETDIVKPRDFDDKSKLSVRYNKDVRTSVFNIDTRYRAYYTGDTAVGQTANLNTNYISPIVSTAASLATHFVFRLSRLVKNAMSVKLTSLEIPNKFYSILTYRGNRSFGIRATGTPNSSFSGVYISNGAIGFPNGTNLSGLNVGMSVTFYNFTSFGNIFAGTTYFVSLVGPDYITVSNTLVEPGLTYPIFNPGSTANTATMDVFTTAVVPEGYYNDINIHDRVSTALNSLSISGSGSFSSSLDPVTKRTTIANLSGYTYDFHFGNPTTPQVYPTILSMLGFNQLKTTSISGVALTTYLNVSSLKSEDVINMNVDTYFYIAINDWNNVEHQSKNDSFFTVFAKIPINVDTGKLIYDNDSTNTTTKIIRFLQPTNIQSLEIQLLDGFGTQLQLDNNVNYSMTLEIEEVLSQSLYEKLREL